MKNKECFETYEAAREQYETIIVPQFGATRMDWGFGRWLWLDVIDDPLKAWLAMDEARILTVDGRKRLARAEKETEK